jgi:hypothetical protein
MSYETALRFSEVKGPQVQILSSRRRKCRSKPCPPRPVGRASCCSCAIRAQTWTLFDARRRTQMNKRSDGCPASSQCPSDHLTSDCYDRCRLRLVGNYRPPLGHVGAALDLGCARPSDGGPDIAGTVGHTPAAIPDARRNPVTHSQTAPGTHHMQRPHASHQRRPGR